MEELFLRGFLAGDELNIVDEECVGLAVLFAETHGGTGADGLDQLVCKLVALDVNDILIREILFELVTDGVEQVRFAEAGVAVDKEGIVVFGRLFCNIAAGCAGKFIGAALDERFKRVFVFVIVRHALFFFFLHRGDELIGESFAENALYGVVQALVKAALDGGFVKFVRRLNDCNACSEIERDGDELAEPGFIAHVGDLLFAVVANEVPCF